MRPGDTCRVTRGCQFVLFLLRLCGAGAVWRVVLLLAGLAWVGAVHAALPAVSLTHGKPVDLIEHARLYADRGEAFPARAADIASWQASLQAAPKVSLLGGSYWMLAEVVNATPGRAWVFDPNDTLIDQVEARLYGPQGQVQAVTTGYRSRHEYMLHYGKDIVLEPGQRYQVLVRFSSPYYARVPVMSVIEQQPYAALVNWENLQIIGSLGALLALGMFNFFMFLGARDRASLFYTLYVLTYALAWAMTLHVGADLFDFHDLRLHYVPFFLLPVFSTLFYTHFLRLKLLFPRLARISRVNLVLPLLLLPSCFFALSYAHTLATIVITVWITLALVCGIVAWKNGYRPARYFVLAFVALLVPGLMILPANLGLVPALVANAQLLTLLGGTLDGILLAFALADQIRLLRNNLETIVADRTAELVRANNALTAAKEHAEIVSRHRIDFLSAMSHDIRTPLAGVLGMLKFALRDRSVIGRTQEYLKIGLHNGESLLAILNDILDFSKIDAGKLTLETVSFRLTDVIDDALGILQGHADAKSLLLRSVVAPDLPPYVEGDPTRIRQIMINLLGNAIKFTDRGEVRLEVLLHASGEHHATVQFAVIDTGPGIAPDVRKRLFQKFEQADHSTTRRYGGTGLGLAICKELVTLMGGQISVQSEVGGGSCFTFRLPMAYGAAPAEAQQAPPRRERHTHRLRILCAEDVRTNQIIIGTLLDNMGHEHHLAENGLAAIEALSLADYDLVIMDGRMPIMDGEQATRLIRKGGFEGKEVRDPDIPILALTANASEQDSSRYIAAGMNGFLSKPLDEALLFDKLDQVIAALLARGRPLPPNDGATPAGIEHELALQFGVAPAAAPAAANQALPAGNGIHITGVPGMSGKHLARIAHAFLDEAPRRVLLARAALDANDLEGASAAFHALKGSAGYLSTPQLHSLAARMETLAANGEAERVAELFPQLVDLLEHAIGDLQTAMPSAMKADSTRLA